MSKNLRKLSKYDYRSSQGNTLEAIRTGSLQRIADATEIMAKNHNDLIRDRDYWKREWEWERDENERLRKSNAALRGHFNRLKKQLVKF